MQVKNYEAPSIQEAMEMIRKELGQDAVILSTSRKGGNFEVVAARDGDDLPQKKPSVPAPVPLQQSPAGKTRPSPSEGYPEAAEVQEALSVLFDIIGAGGRVRGDELSPFYHRLVASGMSKASACKIAEELRADGRMDGKAFLAERLPVRTMRKRIRALVGPTGAGKTTTLAKLAAEAAFGEKQRVAIITTDTHRIAATEQVRIYAKIMDIPMAVASDRASYLKAIERFDDADVIFIDTPGRSHGDKEALEALNRTLRACENTETCLVLSLTSTREHLLRSVEHYGLFESASIVFTKLDECSRYGAICDIMEKTDIPVSYLTMGQNVPEDIEKATSAGIAELILGR